VKFLRRSGGARAHEESPEERQYRYLLRTADAETAVLITASALAVLDEDDRSSVLAVVREQLVAGARLTPHQVHEIARLLCLGESRRPGAVLRHTPDGPLGRLASAATRTTPAAPLLQGYAAWDGLDPEPSAESEFDGKAGGPGSGEAHYNIVKGRAEGGFST
jgi:hypothetical protein